MVSILLLASLCGCSVFLSTDNSGVPCRSSIQDHIHAAKSLNLVDYPAVPCDGLEVRECFAAGPAYFPPLPEERRPVHPCEHYPILPTDTKPY